jgi:3-hydroxyacyl-[acyl-carrier-protein] dehydratase
MKFVFVENAYCDGDLYKGSLEVKEDWPVFQWHFPGFPVLPGSIQLEIMAQHLLKGCVDYFQNSDQYPDLPPNSNPGVIKIENARFHRPVFPGDVLHFEGKPIDVIFPMVKVSALLKVKDQKVSSATFLAGFINMGNAGITVDLEAFFSQGSINES